MKKKRAGGRISALAIAVSLVMLAVLVASCGGESQQAQETTDEQKYPPGTSEEMLTETTGGSELALEVGEERTEAQEEEDIEEEGSASPDVTSAELSGARFTVIEATRQESNADILSTGQREVPGDYYEIELEIENVGDDIVDLSEYSFRIWSEGIDAEAYEDYYGMDDRLGGYVSENMISAVLLDYTTLQPAAYKLKIGETVDGVFLFFDLNPKRTAHNEAITGEGTNLVFYKSRGEDSGESVEINLAGYPE